MMAGLPLPWFALWPLVGFAKAQHQQTSKYPHTFSLIVFASDNPLFYLEATKAMSAEKFQNPVVRWIDHRLPIFSMLDHEKYDYPV